MVVISQLKFISKVKNEIKLIQAKKQNLIDSPNFSLKQSRGLLRQFELRICNLSVLFVGQTLCKNRGIALILKNKYSCCGFKQDLEVLIQTIAEFALVSNLQALELAIA